MPSPTPSKNYTYPAHGGSVNSWDTPLNTNFDTIDSNLGGTYNVVVGSSIVGTTFNSTYAAVSNATASITLPPAQAVNLNYEFSGTMGSNVDLVFPAVGGIYDILNSATGAFTLTAKTPAGTGVIINQAGSNLVVCDSVNVNYANSNQGKAQLNTYLGNPNTNVAGNVATVNGGVTDVTWDETNQQIYVATTQGTAATTVWTPQINRCYPQGVLTVSATASSPIITANTTATTIQYVPYIGSWTVLSNGTVVYPYNFSTMQLTLTASQAANIIYDVFMYDNATAGIIAPIIGTGPAWSISTAGSGSRGVGAGTTELNRNVDGIWMNAVQITLTNGASTYVCPPNRGIYLGSIYIDSVAGNVTCHRSYGQSRKWGVWNCYNRTPVYLKAGDSTATWTYSVATIRPSRNDSTNKVTVFSGLPEEIYNVAFDNKFTSGGALAPGQFVGMGIGWNSTTVFSGFTGQVGSVAYANTPFSFHASYINPPALGIQDVTCLEEGNPASTSVFSGTEANMVLSALWRA